MSGTPLIGIGPALRKAREERTKTIDEAARDTKIRVSYLQALENESFDKLLGDAYVRGSLRSYSQYLGLDPEKVLGAYSRAVGEHEPSQIPEPAPETADMAVIGPADHRKTWLLLAGAAAAVIVVLVLMGLLSGSTDVPPAAVLPTAPPSVIPDEPQVTVGLIAKHEIDAVITIDGQQAFTGTLKAGEARSFVATALIGVQLARGGVVTIRVNDVNLGTPGDKEHTFSAEYGPPAATPRPSPQAASSPSPSPEGGAP